MPAPAPLSNSATLPELDGPHGIIWFAARARPQARIVAVNGAAGIIKLNEGRKTIRLRVQSTGDRPIQVAFSEIQTQSRRLMLCRLGLTNI